MSIPSSIKRDRFFALKKNNAIEEFFTVEDALNSSDNHFVIIDKFKDFFTPANGFDWRISEFTFIDNNKRPFNLSNNSWTIHSIDTTYKSSSRIAFDITISDPSKKIKRISCDLDENRRFEDSNLHDVVLVQLALEKLYQHSKFQSWEQMDLELENKNLRERIHLLEKKLIN